MNYISSFSPQCLGQTQLGELCYNVHFVPRQLGVLTDNENDVGVEACILVGHDHGLPGGEPRFRSPGWRPSRSDFERH